MRITADRDVRVGSGMCTLTVPEVFDQGKGEGLVAVAEPEQPGELRERVTEAVGLCHARAPGVR